MSGKLYIVPTPIGNLDDITMRARKVLNDVDLILAEDTRKTSILLRHFNIDKKLISYHMHNEHQTIKSVMEKLLSEINIALVSDAGTPSISDPGFLIIRECIKNDVKVETLPGAVAFIPALVNSGLPSERFCFEGFLPQKKGRQKRLLQLMDESRTMIFYESPHRFLKALNQFSELFGSDREASVSRELTKIYEETKRGTIGEIAEYFKDKIIKGEIVIIIKGKD